MGTNFYLRGHGHDDDPAYHIGKRSAAGYWCFDCGTTLCINGESGVHRGGGYHDKCPRCGQRPSREPLSQSSAGLELGFNKDATAVKKGVRSCSSFGWAMHREDLEKKARQAKGQCPHCDQNRPDPENVIENEYGDLFTLAEFLEVVNACPIHFHHIDERFC